MARFKSDLITIIESTPTIVLADSGRRMGRGEHTIATFALTGAENDADVIDMFRVHSTDRILDVLVRNVAITAGTDYDLGFYEVPEFGATTMVAVDIDLLIDGIDLSSANLTWSSQMGNDQTGAVAVGSGGLKVYELLGLTDDPDQEYAVALTANTAGSGAGAVEVRMVLSEH